LLPVCRLLSFVVGASTAQVPDKLRLNRILSSTRLKITGEVLEKKKSFAGREELFL
jgi:hypothetical protein